MTPVEYVELIDSQYSLSREAKLSRYDIAWGMWSRKMNLEIKARLIEVDGKSDEASFLKNVFVYWIIRSQLLELHFKSRFRAGKKRKLAEEAADIKEIILSKKVGTELEGKSLMDLLKGKV